MQAALLALALLPACSSYEHRLRSERDIPELLPLCEAFDALEEQPVKVLSDADPDRPTEVAIYEYRGLDRNRVVVAIHGVLSDHRAWKYVIGGLGGEVDVWALDLPGCGASDLPDPEELGDDGYSPTWLARHVLAALRTQLRDRDQDVKLTLLAHSLGGGAVLRMLGDEALRAEYADVLSHVDGAVLLAPLSFKLVHVDPNLVALAELQDLVFAIGMSLGEVRRAAAEATYHGFVDPRRAPAEDFERTLDILSDAERRHPMQRMLERAVPRDSDGRVRWEDVDELTDDYTHVDVPCLIVWGERDETLPSVHGSELAGRLPHARLGIIPRCMHSVMLERPNECVDLVREFLAHGLPDWEPYHRVALAEQSPIVVEGGENRGGKGSLEEDVSVLNERPAAEAPSTVSVLRGRDLQRSGARYLSDALRMLPGVEVQRLSTTESGVAFRGYVDSSTASQGTLGLLDGRQVYNPFLGNVLWDQLPIRLEDVDQVEIIRGPGSFVHGPNAMHGVVSIKTKAPLDYAESTVSASSHFGSYGSVVAGTTVVARGSHTATKTTAQWEDLEQFETDRTGTQGKGFFSSAFETQLDDDPDQVLGFSGGVSQQRFDLLLPTLEGIPSAVLDNDAEELFLKADYRVGDPDDHAVRIQASWTGFDSESTPDAYYPPFALDLDTLDLDAQATWAGAWNFLTAGLGYRNSTFATADLDVAAGRHTVDQGWLFAQDEIDLGAVSLTLGLRADLHTETGVVWSPRAAAVWEVVDRQFVRASVGRGFRNPSLRELWFDMPIQGVPGAPGTITIAGDDDLRPESLTSFELGYFGAFGARYDAAPSSPTAAAEEQTRQQFETGISAFYNLVDDLISIQRSPGTLVALPVNKGDEESYGVELESRYVFGDFTSAFANYSLTVRRNRADDVRDELTPRHVVNVGATYVGHGLQAMLWTNYYDDTALFGIAIPSYVLVNGSISYGFRLSDRATGQVFIRGFNLLDDVHREHPQGDPYGLILTSGLQLDW